MINLAILFYLTEVFLVSPRCRTSSFRRAKNVRESCLEDSNTLMHLLLSFLYSFII